MGHLAGGERQELLLRALRVVRAARGLVLFRLMDDSPRQPQLATQLGSWLGPEH